ncbi:MAG: hypothetical protein J3K34DRAFT_525288 [Monoraphidium minutum]|nr:MAG: hypothetical protein J3K34DRAFT_525288 [Monoraphidium minutum]
MESDATSTQAGREVAVAAWVALVDERGAVLLDTRVRQEDQVPRGASWRHWGGVPLAACASAPPRAAVLAALLPLLEGRLLVGHGVARDAAALGLRLVEGPAAPAPGGAAATLELQLAAGGADDPPAPRADDAAVVSGSPLGPPAPRVAAYDTKAFPGFQGRGGSARSLQRLARDHLGRSIQQAGAAEAGELLAGMGGTAGLPGCTGGE